MKGVKPAVTLQHPDTPQCVQVQGCRSHSPGLEDLDGKAMKIVHGFALIGIHLDPPVDGDGTLLIENFGIRKNHLIHPMVMANMIEKIKGMITTQTCQGANSLGIGLTITCVLACRYG